MTLNLQIDEGSGWDDVDIEAEGISNFKLVIGYSHPATLTFCVHQAQHTKPIAAYAKVRFWDDAETDRFGNDFTEDNPLFLGFVEQIQPGDETNKIDYTCLDATARASSQTPVMSTAWTDATTADDAAVPRLILNASIDNDDDWGFARGFNLTVGQIIAILLDDPLLRLRTFEAAPASAAYESSDLAGMNYVPQEKIVFTSEPIRSAVMRLIDDWEPRWRMLFYPGTKKWRFGDISASPEVTYTLNDFSVSSPHPVLKLQMDRSLENRYTAVRIYGPEATENVTVTLDGGGLTDVSDGPTLETYAAGATVQGKNKYQITDETKRRMGRILPVPIYAPQAEVRFAPNAWNQESAWTRGPTLMVKYKANNAGTDAWQSVAGVWYYDPATGVIDFKDRYLYRYNPYPQVEGGILQPHYEVPEDVQLVYPSFIEPLAVRVPETGWEGTAYSEDGLENQLTVYDESLAVGYLFGTPVTSASILARFEILAQKLLDVKKDVLYHGGLTLEGIDYEFHLLDRRLNIAAVDGDGNELITGWEAMRGYVTDVEYDWEEQTTTVQFNSDHSELLGFDMDRLKTQLKLGAARIDFIVTAWATLGTVRRQTEWGTHYLAQSITVGGGITPVVVDPYFGTESPIG